MYFPSHTPNNCILWKCKVLCISEQSQRGDTSFFMSTVTACIWKNVIRPTSPGGYDEGCSKMTKTDGCICSRVCIWYRGGEMYSFMANLYTSHLNSHKKLSLGLQCGTSVLQHEGDTES